MLFLLGVAFLMSANLFSQSDIKYVFYFIGDGMGVNQVNGTEMYLAEKEDSIGTVPLCFTQFPVATFATTYSATNSVTDSSAAGTALASGEKTANGTIGMNVDHTAPVYSVAQLAKNSGAKVGVISTVSIDHATPAAFYAHKPDRNMYYEIACDIPEAGFDFYGGAGFASPATSFNKEEVVSIFEILKRRNYNIAVGLSGYEQVKNKGNIVMVEKREKNDAMKFAIDRDSADLSLKQMTECAIRSLYNRGKGFFLMVEGGMIDWACHSNDAATAFEEVVDMDEAVKVAFEFYKKYPKETLIVVTADHETGGLSLGNGPYKLNLKLLSEQKVSKDVLAKKINELHKSGKKVEWENIRTLLRDNLGFWDTVRLTKDERSELLEAFEEEFVKNEDDDEEVLYSQSGKVADKAIELLNRHANIEWGSHGHSAGYVPVFVIGEGSELFNGKLDNTDIPKKIAELAGYGKKEK